MSKVNFYSLFIHCVVILFAINVTAQKTEKDKGQSDFDFEIGNWHTKLKLLKSPLLGSTTWIDYEGTSIVTKVLDGKANLVELKVSCSTGHIEGLSLRLFNPETNQWSLNFANIRDGLLTIPAVGSFKDGQGEFYNEDTFNGKKILVRFIISKITLNSCHFEQAFSSDDGKTWEINWIADDTRMTKKGN
ncbi:MAG: hypothetical protein ABI426_00400 [Flavobacterium sp.]